MKTFAILTILIITGFGVSHDLTRGFIDYSIQEEPTQIGESQITKQQEMHSKLYDRYGTGKKLRDIAKTEKGDVEIRIPSPMAGGVSNSTEPTREEVLRMMSCKADAIVLGLVKSKTSGLTESGDFIFTDYLVIVEDVLKGKDSLSSPIKKKIVLTGPGGTIMLDGTKIRAIDSVLEPFEIHNRYLLFLKYLPETDSYEEIDGGGSFLLTGQSLTKHSEASTNRLSNERDAKSFLSEIRNASDEPCNK